MNTKRPHCFFDITVDGAPLGRIEFELYSDIVPITAENFRCLCTGEKEGKKEAAPEKKETAYIIRDADSTELSLNSCFKEETSPTTTELEENQSMETSSMMRTSKNTMTK